MRHGQSIGNAEGRMQGQSEYALTDVGLGQAQALATWMRQQKISWSHAYVSPQSRAVQTYAALRTALAAVEPDLDADLKEIHAGALEGLAREQIERDHPGFFARDVTQLGDFSEFGGESYDVLQARVTRVWERLIARHGATGETVLVLSHGGLLYQLMKAAICVPVPRVAILRFSNCSCSKLHFRDRRGTFMAEVTWHVPIELMGGVATANVSRLF